MIRQVNEIDKRIGANMRALRQAHKYAISQVAAALGVTHQQVQKYETGVNRISASMLYKVAEFYAMPAGTFFLTEGAFNNIIKSEVE